MSILNGQDATADERESYLKAAAWKNNEAVNNDEKALGDLSPEQMERMAEREQFILTITENGYGKRTSSYEYRTTGRGGQGIVNIVTSDRNGAVVASGPVTTSEQLMLLTNAGKIIRIGIQDIRIAGRNTQGVTLFRIDPEEKVVSVAKVPEPGEEAEDQRDEDLESPQAAQDAEIEVDGDQEPLDDPETDLNGDDD
jgi:DNA gyrase subunit A